MVRKKDDVIYEQPLILFMQLRVIFPSFTELLILTFPLITSLPPTYQELILARVPAF